MLPAQQCILVMRNNEPRWWCLSPTMHQELCCCRAWSWFSAPTRLFCWENGGALCSASCRGCGAGRKSCDLCLGLHICVKNYGCQLLPHSLMQPIELTPDSLVCCLLSTTLPLVAPPGGVWLTPCLVAPGRLWQSPFIGSPTSLLFVGEASTLGIHCNLGYTIALWLLTSIHHWDL